MNNKGNTMFETLIAFVVLAIILAIVYQMIAFCGEMRMKATDTNIILNEYNENIYKKTIPEDKVSVADRHNETVPLGGPLFYLRVSDETSAENLIGTYDYNTDPYRLRMNFLGAHTYKSIDPRIESEKLVTPKSLQFYYFE